MEAPTGDYARLMQGTTAAEAQAGKDGDKTSITDKTKQPDVTKEGVLKTTTKLSSRRASRKLTPNEYLTNTYARLQKDAQDGHL